MQNSIFYFKKFQIIRTSNFFLTFSNIFENFDIILAEAPINFEDWIFLVLFVIHFPIAFP